MTTIGAQKTFIRLTREHQLEFPALDAIGAEHRRGPLRASQVRIGNLCHAANPTMKQIALQPTKSPLAKAGQRT